MRDVAQAAKRFTQSVPTWCFVGFDSNRDRAHQVDRGLTVREVDSRGRRHPERPVVMPAVTTAAATAARRAAAEQEQRVDVALAHVAATVAMVEPLTAIAACGASISTLEVVRGARKLRTRATAQARPEAAAVRVERAVKAVMDQQSTVMVVPVRVLGGDFTATFGTVMTALRVV